jgi:hypothetical protein
MFQKVYFLPYLSVYVGFELLTALFTAGFHSGFLLGLLFDPEEGGDMFLRNVS